MTDFQMKKIFTNDYGFSQKFMYFLCGEDIEILKGKEGAT